MVDKILGVDQTNSATPLKAWLTTLYNGTAHRDVALEDLLYFIKDLTEKTNPVEGTDYLILFDVAGDAVKIVKPSNLAITKGRVEFYNASRPTTVAATDNVLVGASSPAEQFLYWDFVNGSVTYVEFLCRLIGYGGGGLTLSALVLRTSAAAAETYIFEAAIRRINAASEDLGAAQTYDYNAVTVTVPAGPPNAGIPMVVTIAFTDGADMDSLANGEFFYLRFRRNGGTATDTARVLAGISVVET